MMQQGLWILMLFLPIGKTEIILVPFATAPNYQLCKLDESYYEKLYDVEVICTQEREL